jgi:hypothetical protein
MLPFSKSLDDEMIENVVQKVISEKIAEVLKKDNIIFLLRQEIKHQFEEILQSPSYSVKFGERIKHFIEAMCNIDFNYWKLQFRKLGSLEKILEKSPKEELIYEFEQYIENLKPYLQHIAQTEQQFFEKMKELEKKYGI